MKVHDEHVIARVLDTTVEMILARGARGWNMDELAERSGLSKRTLYKIVGSRDELLERVILRQMEDIIDLVASLAAAEKDAARALAGITVNTANLVSSFEMVDLFKDLERQYPAVEARIQEMNRRRTEPIVAILQRGIDDGTLRADVKVEFIVELAFGVIDTCVHKGYRGADLRRRITQGFDILMRGLLADAAAIARYEEGLK